MTDESLWAARHERVRRCFVASIELYGYLALSAEQETEATWSLRRPSGREEGQDRTGATCMNVALGQWIATLANQRIDQYGETALEALTWVQEWVDIREGAYRALGAPYGTGEDDLLRWLDERKPLIPETAIDPAAQQAQGPAS